jgi:hypothetical protein
MSFWHVRNYLLGLEVLVSRYKFLNYCLLQVGLIVAHLDLRKGIWTVINNDGSVKDNIVNLFGSRQQG